jgi:hypothetical protein
MSRRDSYLDAMLKHLGTTYYQTLQGEATSSDVAEAVSSVREKRSPRYGRRWPAARAGTRFSRAAIRAAPSADGESRT